MIKILLIEIFKPRCKKPQVYYLKFWAGTCLSALIFENRNFVSFFLVKQPTSFNNGYDLSLIGMHFDQLACLIAFWIDFEECFAPLKEIVYLISVSM